MFHVLVLIPFSLIAGRQAGRAVLFQQRGSSLGGAFGGDNFSATFHKRRGAELFLFRASIVLGILFVSSAFVALIIK